MIQSLKKYLGLQRSIENPAVALTSSRILEHLGQLEDQTEVNYKTALGLGAVHQAVNMISGDCAKLPLEVFRRRPDLGPKAREVDKRHPAYWACARSASPSLSAYKFWRRFYVHCLIWGRAYAFIDKSDPSRYKLVNLLPDRTAWSDEEKYKTPTSPEGMFITETSDGKLVPLAASEVFMIEGLAVDGSNSCAPIKLARQAWSISLATQKMKSRFFEAGGVQGGFLEIPAHFTADSASALEEGFRRRLSKGVSAAFTSIVLRDGAKFHANSIPPDSMQLSQTTDQNVKDVARWFNISSSLLGVAGSVSYGSLKEDNRSYFDRSLSHYLYGVQTEAFLKLLTEEEQNADSHTFDHNVRSLIAVSPREQADIASIEMANGCLTANEYRAATNRNPLPGGAGDLISVPMNMHLITPDGVDLNVWQPEQPAEPPKEEEPAESVEEPIDEAATAAARAVMVEADERATRSLLVAIKKEVNRKKPDRFLAWFDSKRDDLLGGLTAAIGPAQTVYASLSRRSLETIREERTGEAVAVLDAINDAGNLPAEQMVKKVLEICKGSNNE